MRVQFASPIEGSEQEQVGHLNELYNAAEAERRRIEPEWFANVAMLAGHSGEAVARDIQRFRRIETPRPEKAQDRQNLIYMLARQAAAIGVDAAADQIAVAATSDPEDMAAAELATDLIAHRYDADEEYNLRLHEELWRLTCGWCVRDTRWDPEAEGYTVGGKLLRGIGDISSRGLTPFSVYACPWNDCSRPRRWYIIADVVDTDEIGDLYGVQVEPEDVADAAQSTDRLLSSVVTGEFGGRPPKRKRAALVKQLYHAPTAKDRSGKVYVWVSGKLLDTTELPDGEMPLVELLWFPIPGRIYPYPFITSLAPLQREIDKTMQQWVELKNRRLRGDIAVRGQRPMQEGYSPVTTDWNEETDQKIIYMDGQVQEFEFMRYELNSQDILPLIELKRGMMEMIAGVNSGASLGAGSKGQPTATELALRKEADTAGLALFSKLRDRAQSKIQKQKVILAREHYTIPRFIRVTGSDNSAKTALFYGAELRGVDDVRPRPVPLLTEAMKNQIRQQLAQADAWNLSGPVQVVAAKVKMILESGLPDADKEIERLTGGITAEQIMEANGQAISQAIGLNLMQGELAGMQMQAMAEQAIGPVETEPSGPMAAMAAG